MSSKRLEMADNFLRCRTYGHGWDEIPVTEAPSARWGEAYGRIILRCVRCTTERYDYLDWRGDVMGRNYLYPDGYRDAEKVAKSRYRLELLGRRSQTTNVRRMRRSGGAF